MDRRTPWIAATVVAVTITAAAATYALVGAAPSPVAGPSGGGSSLLPAAANVLDAAPARSQLSELDRLIGVYDRQTSANPNATGYTFLGELQLERGRLTGDVSSYSGATTALRSAYRLSPSDPEVGSMLASVLFTTHQFGPARALADRIHRESGDPGALAVESDADLELGRYLEATAGYETLASSYPDASAVLIRLARLSYLNGNAAQAWTQGAEAQQAAIREGAFDAKLAWYGVFRAKLAIDLGRYDDAVRIARWAVHAAPDYHLARATLGAAEASAGDHEAATREYRRAIAIVPEPAYLAALGDLLSLDGRSQEAARQFDTVRAIATLSPLQQRLYDRQYALFAADHDRDLTHAYDIAASSLEVRKDIYGYDALGWVSYKLGRLQEAKSAADQALSLGTIDPRLWYHAGMIEAGLGNDERARELLGRALQQSPMFDAVQALVARETLRSLEGSA